MRRIVLGAVLAAALALPVALQAAPITVSANGSLGTAPASPETQNTGFPGYLPANGNTNATSPDGYHNGIVTLTAGTYSLQYWGSGNSSFNNTFTLNAGSGYSILSAGTTIVSIGPGGNGGFTATPLILAVTAPSATLNFTFSTTGTPACTVSSGSSDISACDYIAGVDGVPVAGSSSTGNVGYLGFADRAEAVDIDHQDLTIRITQVPEPASLGLLGLGLAGLGLARRRRANR